MSSQEPTHPSRCPHCGLHYPDEVTINSEYHSAEFPLVWACYHCGKRWIEFDFINANIIKPNSNLKNGDVTEPLTELAELYEELGNRSYLNGDRKSSEIYYGVMVAVKRMKYPECKDEIKEELMKVKEDIIAIRASKQR